MKKLWLIFIGIFVFSFAVLGWVGTEIFRQAPPIPREVVTTDGQVLIPAEEIQNGQNVWQAMGGTQVGSIWGHGSDVAPDWSADYLHREALFLLNSWANSEFGNGYDNLNSEQQAVLRQRLQNTVRTNTYDEATGRLTINPLRAQAYQENLKHYSDIFSNGSKDFAIQRNAQADPTKLRQLNSFFFWTAWLAFGLFIAPFICEYEPKYQKLGVNVLFLALLIVVLGSMIGQWMSVMHLLSGDLWFWFGHHGYEYVDLGKVWQAALFIGLLLWLFLIARTAIPALRQKGTPKSLIALYLITTSGIAFFYAPGLFWGMRSHLSVVEYWRWWVVHLWVEGFFEVFATVVIAFLFAKLRVIRPESAAQASLLTGAIYLSGEIIGTLHHLYFAGTPTVAIAFGSTFRALEIVPLLLVGHEAVENIRRSKVRPWLQQYKWVVYILYCRRVLEYGRRGNFRIYGQSADCALLYAGLKYDGGSRARCALRRLWNARFRFDALLSAGDETRTQMEGKTDQVCVLGNKYRNASGNRIKSFARRFIANLSIGQCRLLVGAFTRIYADRLNAIFALDANARRYDFCRRRDCIRLVRARFDVFS